MATLDILLKCEASKPVPVRHLDGMLFSQDVQANRIMVSFVRNGAPETLSGNISANFVRADGSTVVETGSVSENVATVVMPSAAYAVPGPIAVFIKHTASGTTSTIAAFTAYVYKSSTDTIVDPGTVVPNINELLAMVDECEDAAAAATAAAAVADAASGVILELKSALSNFETNVKQMSGKCAINYNYTSGKFVKVSDGTISNGSGGKATDFVKVSDYRSIQYARITVTDTNYAYGMVFYGSDKTTVIGGETAVRSAQSRGYVDRVIDVPAGAVYARFTFWNEQYYTDITDPFYLYGISVFDGLSDDLTAVKSAINIQTKSMGDIDFIWTAGYITNSGEIHEQTGLSQYYSQLIHVKDMARIEVSVGDGIQVAVANYNKDKGDFTSRYAWTTEDFTINNETDIILMVSSVTSTDPVRPIDDLIGKLGIRVIPLSNIMPLEFDYNFEWAAGYIDADGNIDTRQQYNNYHSKKLSNFDRILIVPNNLRQFNVAYFDKHTGEFISRTSYITEKTVIDNTHDVIISIATASPVSTYGTIALNVLLGGFVFYVSSAFVSKWHNKKAAFIGDSITYGANTDSDNVYYKIINEMVGFSNVYADGVTGSCYSVTSNYGSTITPITQRYQNIPNDCDLIVIFAGSNDWGHNTPIGTITDMTDISLYGALNTVISGVLEANPGVRLVLITPLHRWGFGDYTEDTGNNGQGYPLKAYVDAIKNCAEMWGVPVIDLFSTGCLNPRVSAIKTNYVTDGLHPNAKGHNILAKRILPMLEEL